MDGGDRDVDAVIRELLSVVEVARMIEGEEEGK